MARSRDPSSWLWPVAGRALEFRGTGQESDLTLVPLNRIFDKRYAVCFKVLARSTPS